MSRFNQKFNSLQISQFRLSLLWLDGGVETWLRFLDLDLDFLIVETSFLKLWRFSRLSRLTFCRCQDRESQSRHNWDKSSCLEKWFYLNYPLLQRGSYEIPHPENGQYAIYQSWLVNGNYQFWYQYLASAFGIGQNFDKKPCWNVGPSQTNIFN